MRMKCIAGMWAACSLVMAGTALAADVAGQSNPQDMAKNPESIVAAIRHQSVQESAAIVGRALAVIFSSDWPEAKKREHCIALVTYAVALKGQEAAPMMRILRSLIPPARVPLVAATAVIAAGDNSPAVAKAMISVLAADAQAAEDCRSACANPSTVLLPTEIGIVRGITLPTPSVAPAKAPPLPTIIRAAEKYSGQ